MEKQDLRLRKKLPVQLTLHERDLIRSSTFLDPDFGTDGVIDGKNITLELSIGEIEEVRGYVAAEANHTRDTKLPRELDQVFDKLQFFWTPMTTKMNRTANIPRRSSDGAWEKESGCRNLTPNMYRW